MRQRRTLRNDPDGRMSALAIQAAVDFPEADLLRLDTAQLPAWIDMLREAEASARRLRLRLEALRDGQERTCPVCQRAVAGRADRIFCGPTCRQRAHRVGIDTGEVL